MSNKLDRVAIVGSTHGCELTGGYLVKKFEDCPKLVRRESFETITLLANHRAFEAGTRYIDTDLNRAFSEENFNNPKTDIYESVRSKEITEILGTRKDSKVDFIIDLHSTTSNMGLTIILGTENDPLILELAAYLSNTDPLVRLFMWSNTQENHFLRSLCKRSIAIEVGAIAHNTLHPFYFSRTEKSIYKILDFLDSKNKQPISSKYSIVTIFKAKELIDYPRDRNGQLEAMIHPNLISKDYHPIDPGDPLFQTFGGTTIIYEGESTVYPAFINEAAYIEKGIAMCLCDKHEIPLKGDR